MTGGGSGDYSRVGKTIDHLKLAAANRLKIKCPMQSVITRSKIVNSGAICDANLGFREKFGTYNNTALTAVKKKVL
jgi:hypothetical protein